MKSSKRAQLGSSGIPSSSNIIRVIPIIILFLWLLYNVNLGSEKSPNQPVLPKYGSEKPLFVSEPPKLPAPLIIHKEQLELLTKLPMRFNREGKKSNPVILSDLLDLDMELISVNKTVTADVRGNLGPPSVVTKETNEDWLKDRWQAALDMTGAPISGEHWLKINLTRPCLIRYVLIDWEDAYSTDWFIQASNDPDTLNWTHLASSKKLRLKSKYKHHVIHDIKIEYTNNTNHFRGAKNQEDTKPYIKTYQYVRLLILKPATRWGSSVWRCQVWGVDPSKMSRQIGDG